MYLHTIIGFTLKNLPSKITSKNDMEKFIYYSSFFSSFLFCLNYCCLLSIKFNRMNHFSFMNLILIVQHKKISKEKKRRNKRTEFIDRMENGLSNKKNRNDIICMNFSLYFVHIIYIRIIWF